MALTEEQIQAILGESAKNTVFRDLQEELYRPKGIGKTTRPKNFLRKRKAARKRSRASKRRNRA